MATDIQAGLPAKYWHVSVEAISGNDRRAIENDLEFKELEHKLLRPWHENRKFVLGGEVFESPAQVKSIRVSVTERPVSEYRKAYETERKQRYAAMRAKGAFIGDLPLDSRFTALNDGADHTHVLLFENRSTKNDGVIMNRDVQTKSRALLFLDIVGWSKLNPSQIRTFIERALPTLGEITRRRAPVMINTWGDAIIAVFDDVADCAETALALCGFFDSAKGTDGVVDGMKARVGMHFGVVFWTRNPITGQQDVFGPAVHTAARLEPIAAAGHAFCTATFASALGEIDGEGPRAHKLGSVALAKNYGTQEIFVVTARGAKVPVIDLGPSTAKEPAYDELAELTSRLNAKKVGRRTVLAWMTEAATNAKIGSIGMLFAALSQVGATDAKVAEIFWYLMMCGVVEFKAVNFLVHDDYKKTARQMKIAPRGVALLAHVRDAKKA